MAQQRIADIAQVVPGHHSGQSAGGNERIMDRRPCATILGSEEVILAAEHHGADGVLRRVVVDRQSAVIDVATDGCPLFMGIAHRASQRTGGAFMDDGVVERGLEIAQDGHRLRLAQCPPFIGRVVPSPSFDQVQLADRSEVCFGVLFAGRGKTRHTQCYSANFFLVFLFALYVDFLYLEFGFLAVLG